MTTINELNELMMEGLRKEYDVAKSESLYGMFDIIEYHSKDEMEITRAGIYESHGIHEFKDLKAEFERTLNIPRNGKPVDFYVLEVAIPDRAQKKLKLNMELTPGQKLAVQFTETAMIVGDWNSLITKRDINKTPVKETFNTNLGYRF